MGAANEGGLLHDTEIVPSVRGGYPKREDHRANNEYLIQCRWTFRCLLCHDECRKQHRERHYTRRLGLPASEQRKVSKGTPSSTKTNTAK